MDELVPFAGGSAEAVASWVTSPEEAMDWAGVSEWPVPAGLFASWHEEADVVPFLLGEGDPCGYGELWEDGREVELARLVVDPRRRGQGYGRRLVGALVAEAHRRGFDEIWLRVVPENERAIRCYVSAGFVRATPEDEVVFNRRQPREYVWMRVPPGGPGR